jgi:hypothetical protein
VDPTHLSGIIDVEEMDAKCSAIGYSMFCYRALYVSGNG